MPPYYQPGGPDTIDHLIVYGIDHLTQADFVPEQDLPFGLQGTEGNDVLTGNILENSIYGLAGNDIIDGGGAGDRIIAGAGNDRVMGGDGNDTIHDGNGYGLTPLVDFDLIHGGNGDDNLILGVSAGDRDRVFGDAGHDQFVFQLDEAQPHGTGQDVVMDFAQGEDKLAFQVQETGSGQHSGSFAMFDSNHNGVLDNGDAHVSVRPITIDGVSKGSTILQIADALLPAEAHVSAADQRVIVWGQTHLTADDFSPTTSGASQVAAAPGIDSLVATASPEAAG
jgi:Ca2+-binding RTX toxin-like protein